MYYIFDIDGTLSDTSERVHLVTVKPKNHEEFHNRAKDDPPTRLCGFAGVMMDVWGMNTYFVSGRPVRIFDDTLCWLKINVNPFIVPAQVLLKKDNDNRPDFLIKEELLASVGIQPKDCVLIDDRPSVLKYFASKGATVLDPKTWNNEDIQLQFL